MILNWTICISAGTSVIYIESTKPIHCLPLDDIMIAWDRLYPPDSTYLIGGRYENTSGSSLAFSYLRFENKMKDYSMCELSFYVYEYDTCTSPVRSINMYVYLLEIDDWTESSITEEQAIDMKYPQSSVNKLERRLGYHKYNITKMVKDCGDTPIFTLRIHGNGGIGEANYLVFYSKDANVNDEYKPQLIWS